MAFIHVVIPVYNAKCFLRETVTSVLSQPSKDIDIVLINDGSTDGSAELCDELASCEERVTVIHQKNSGVSVARNVGIEYFLNNNTEGYIAFLDADDLWCTNVFTQNLIQLFTIDPDAELFAFGSVNMTEDGRRYSYPKLYQDFCIDGGNEAIWKLEGHFCSNLYSIHLLKKYGIRFMNGLKYSEDKIFMLQCCFLAQKIRFFHRLMHIYRHNSSSTMSKYWKIPPVEYYLPIVDGWIASDLFLNSLKNGTNKTTNFGFVLAGIYFMDMERDHFKRWRDPTELEPIKEHPYYYLFEDMKKTDVSIKQYKDHKLLLKHPLLYRWKFRLIGTVEFAAKLFLKIKPFTLFREYKKYPLLVLPE